MSVASNILATIAAALATASLSVPTASDPARPPPIEMRASGHATKKGGDEPILPPLLATLAQLHTDERVMLDAQGPEHVRFDGLLSDRVTGTQHALDPRLLDLLRRVATRFGEKGAVRIELVSGFRSPKLNELLRKKGHHVASHSQHSLGHACDFRIVPVGATKGIEPKVLEKEIRALGWDGGVGIYPTQADWFVHADVGPNRRWVN